MDSVLAIFLLLGAAPAGPSGSGPGPQSRVQVVASATILRGEAIEFGKPSGRNKDDEIGRQVFQFTTMRTEGEIAGLDGMKIRLQEFQ